MKTESVLEEIYLKRQKKFFLHKNYHKIFEIELGLRIQGQLTRLNINGIEGPNVKNLSSKKATSQNYLKNSKKRARPIHPRATGTT